MWRNNRTWVLYKIEEGCVYCKYDSEPAWRVSAHGTDVERFLKVIGKGIFFKPIVIDLENK